MQGGLDRAKAQRHTEEQGLFLTSPGRRRARRGGPSGCLPSRLTDPAMNHDPWSAGPLGAQKLFYVRRGRWAAVAETLTRASAETFAAPYILGPTAAALRPSARDARPLCTSGEPLHCVALHCVADDGADAERPRRPPTAPNSPRQTALWLERRDIGHAPAPSSGVLPAVSPSAATRASIRVFCSAAAANSGFSCACRRRSS